MTELKIGDKVFTERDLDREHGRLNVVNEAMELELARARQEWLHAGVFVPEPQDPYKRMTEGAKAVLRQEHRELFPRGAGPLAGVSEPMKELVMGTLRAAHRQARSYQESRENVGAVSPRPPEEVRVPWMTIRERGTIGTVRAMPPAGQVGGNAGAYLTVRAAEFPEAEVARFAVLASWRRALDRDVDCWWFSGCDGAAMDLKTPDFYRQDLVQLSRDWDPDNDEDVAFLDSIRWAHDRPLVIVGEGEAEPE
jgi:hypothetical protein